MNAIQKRLKKLSKRKFDVAAREDEVELLEELLNAAELDHNILLLYGLGSVGKTALLVYLWELCRKRKVPVSVIDGTEVRSVLDALDTLRQQFPSNKRFRAFDHLLKRTNAIHSKLEKKSGQSAVSIVLSAGIGAGVKTTATKGAQTALISAAGISATGVGGVAVAGIGAALSIMGVTLASRAGNRVIDSFRRHGLSRRQSDFLCRSEALLTEQFVAGINEIAEKRRAVVMIDSYEHLEEIKGMDFWIRDELLARLDRNGVVVIIAGRYRLTDPRWEYWSSLIQEVELSSVE